MDQHQRELMRQASVGDAEAEARLLLERVRAGGLATGQLRMAAYLGHEAAILTGHVVERSSPIDVVRGLPIEGESVIAILYRTKVAMARALLPAWESRVSGDDSAKKAVEAGERWLILGFEDEELGRVFRQACNEFGEASVDLPEESALEFTFQCGRTLRGDEVRDGDLEEIFSIVLGLSHPDSHGFGIDMEHLEPDPEGVALLAEVVRSELVPWVLGTGDPVRERVEARGREVKRNQGRSRNERESR